MTLDFNWDPSDAARELRAVPKRLGRELKLALGRHGDWAGRRWQRGKFGVSTPPWQRNPSPDRLRSRTGKLRRSFRTETRGGGLDVSLLASVGNAGTAAYARLQEEGGTIRPKRGKYLTIPLRANYTAAGRVRFKSAADLRKDPKFSTFIFRSKRGNLIIARRLKRKKNGSKIEPLFVLKTEVKVRPRLGFRKFFFETEAIADREARVGNAVARGVAG